MESSESTTQAKSNNPGSGTSSLASAMTSAPQRSNSQTSLHKAGHIATHRQSFAENQRHPPPSPRAQRHPSFTQQAIQDLLNHPPNSRQANPRFAGRDWRDICLGELISQDDVKWAELDSSVEEATMTLLKNTSSNAVLVRETATSRTAISTFDYNDLNSYLLVVVGLAKPEEEHVELYREIAQKAQSQQAISLREIQELCRKEEMVSLSADSTLDKAIEAFGSGIHRILVTDPNKEVLGVLSQLRLIEFFWDEGANFPIIERLYGSLLRDLNIGSHKIISINADSTLAEALTLMNDEGLTSVAVVDNGLNVTGNISTADVRHLTSATSLPLLKDTCMHFISVILSERGVEHGRDSFPVFHVNPYSTLAHTVAKLVATHSHRMWVVESASPSPSAPATPLLQPSHPALSASSSSSTSGLGVPVSSGGGGGNGSGSVTPTVLVPQTSTTASVPQSPLPGSGFSTSVPAAALPGAHLSGRLTGVVSLTDILNLFARSSGLHPSDPAEQRARRRRSSSSSMRPSLDGGRASLDFRR